MTIKVGPLILVVGPSGAGKDTLLDCARDHFQNNPDVIFPKRIITRPADAGGERHSPVTLCQFQQLCDVGQIAFHWDAHGLRYGIPRAIETHMAQSRAIVVNVSRTVCAPLSSTYDRVLVLSVSVDPAVLGKRLRSRGRESEGMIQNRLARAQAYSVSGANVRDINNNGPIEQAKAAMIEAINQELALIPPGESV